MKVLFLSFSDMIRGGGYHTRILSELRQLRMEGVELYYASFMHLKVFKRLRNVKNFKKDMESMNVKIFPIPFVPSFKLGPFGRGISMLLSTLIILILIKRYKILLIHAQTNYSAYIAIQLKKIIDVKVVSDMHGIAPEEIAIRNLPYIKKKRQMKLATRIEKECIGRVDRLICVSKAMKTHLRDKYPDFNVKINVIPCAVDTERFFFNEKIREEMRQRNQLTNKLIFLYIGDLENYQLLPEMCRLFIEIKKQEPGSFFLILALGDHARFRDLLTAHGILEEDYRISFVSHNEIPKYIMMADIGLLLRKNISINNVASPTKLGEYLACGVPVIATPYIGDIKELFNKNKIGFFTKLDSKTNKELYTFIKDVQENRKTWAYRCARVAKDKLSWKKYGQKIISIYREITIMFQAL